MKDFRPLFLVSVPSSVFRATGGSTPDFSWVYRDSATP